MSKVLTWVPRILPFPEEGDRVCVRSLHAVPDTPEIGGLGGHPKDVLYDNTKNVILWRAVGVDRNQFNRLFLDFAAYYGITPRLCAVYRAQTKDSPQGSGPDSVTENGSILVGVLHRQSNSAPSGETRVQRTGASWLPAPPGDAPAVLLDTLRPSRALERGRLAFRGHQRPPIGISGGLFDHPFAARRVVTIYVDD